MSLVQRVVSPALRTGLTWLSRHRLPQTEGSLQVTGVAAPVDVLRDRWGVPHIYAQSASDALFAQGFVHAQDRLWQMDLQRRLVAGRMSEVLGSQTVPVDRWLRTLGMRRVAEQEVGLLSDETRTRLDAYAAGVNDWMRRRRLPIEFALLRYEPEPWTVVDTLSWVKMMSWMLSVNWEAEILRARLVDRLGPQRAAELEPLYKEGWPLILPGSEGHGEIGDSALKRADAARPFVGPSPASGLGSNNWVLSGARTSTGMPLLANDMHLALNAPAVWYENHVVCKEFDVTGITFPAIPGVVVGHNGYVAWGFTNGFPDVQDLYMERLRRAEDGRVQYEFKGEWLDADVIREEIRVKGAESVTEEVIVTRHGPIINSLAPGLAGEQPLALRWVSLEPDTIIEGLGTMACARNCVDFREALRHWTAPVQNTVYADVEGNIGYSFPGKVPIRAKGDGKLPVPGWSGEYEWMGYVPYEELPHVLNPAQGYIATANNRVTTDEYPYFLGTDHCTVDRAQRIVELIEAQEQIDIPYIQRMQFDQTSSRFRGVAQHLCDLAPDDAEAAAVLEMLRTWNGELAADSAAAAVVQVLVWRLSTLMLTGQLGDLTQRYIGAGPTPVLAESSIMGHRAMEWLQEALNEPACAWFDLGHGEDRAACLKLALQETIEFLKRELGSCPEAWSWGGMHRITFGHTLGRVPLLARVFNRGPYPVGGNGSTVWATGVGLHELQNTAIVGPPFRFIADLGNLRNSMGLLAPGQSGHPGSPHYDDQVDAWFNQGYHPMLYAREDVEQAVEARLRLEPESRG
ncbi:MAG: penicillin acylase family protein [Anaerolineales bacterium]|nr:penicillin acylase family protein [Anaerolineales bacterium]